MSINCDVHSLCLIGLIISYRTYADKKACIIHVFSMSKSFSSKQKTSQRKNSKLQMIERASKQQGLRLGRLELRRLHIPRLKS